MASSVHSERGGPPGAPRLQVIVRMRYAIGFSKPYTLEEIGIVLSLTRERVRQLERDALTQLRKEAKRLRLDAGLNL